MGLRLDSMKTNPIEWSNAEVIALLQEKQPTTRAGFDELDLHLEKIGEGIFRNVYRVGDYPIVVKIPKIHIHVNEAWNDPTNPLGHAQKEINWLTQIEKDSDHFAHLRRYVPEVYYWNAQAGVICTKLYVKRRKGGRIYKREEAIIVHMFRDTLNLQSADYGHNNLMRDERDNPVVVDLGY
jgi:hypothetical protein